MIKTKFTFTYLFNDQIRNKIKMKSPFKEKLLKTVSNVVFKRVTDSRFKTGVTNGYFVYIL